MSSNPPDPPQKSSSFQRQPYVPRTEPTHKTQTAKKKWKRVESELRKKHDEEQNRLEAAFRSTIVKEESEEPEEPEVADVPESREPADFQDTAQGAPAIHELAIRELPDVISNRIGHGTTSGQNSPAAAAPVTRTPQQRVYIRPANLNLTPKSDDSKEDKGSSVSIEGHRPVVPHQFDQSKSLQPLLTNHFEVNTGKVMTFFLYPITWVRSKKYSDLTPAELAGQASDDEKAEEDTGDDHGNDNVNGGGSVSPPSGRKMRRLFVLLLRSLPALNGWKPEPEIASDYRREIVSTQKLIFNKYQLPIDVDVDYYDEDRSLPSRNPIVHTFRISKPKELPIGHVSRKLKGESTNANEDIDIASNPGLRDDFIRALNMFYNHFVNKKSARLHNVQEPSMALKGAQKFYPLQADGSPLRVLGRGLSSLYGFFRSIRYVPDLPFQLNLNTTISAFIQWNITVQQLIARRFFDNMSADPQLSQASATRWAEIDSFLNGLRVRTTYKNDIRILTLTGLADPDSYSQTSRPGPRTIDFWVKDTNGNYTNRRQTVYDHFTRDHGKLVSSDDIVVRCGDRDPTVIPARYVVVLPGQIWCQQEDSLTESLESKSPPTVNRDRIMSRALPALGLQRQGDMDTKLFMGLGNNAQMLQVRPEKLAIPSIIYGEKRRLTPSPGWDLRKAVSCFRNTTFWTATKEKTPSGQQMIVKDPNPQWSFIEFTSGNRVWTAQDRQEFITGLGKALYDFNVGKFICRHAMDNESAWHKIPLTQQGFPNFASLETKLQSDRSIRFWVILLPFEVKKDVYGQIKALADLKLDIKTVCYIKKRHNPQTMSNLALKINLKVARDAGNHKLEKPTKLLQAGTMVVGIDVAHAPKVGGKQVDAPSIAGMAASCDDDFCQWPASVKVNPRPRANDVDSSEEITTLEIMLRERLLCWQNRHKKNNDDKPLPSRILIYRDGLSEDQFNMCLSRELNQQIIPQLEKAYAFCKKPFPQIQLICAVKRHHTRLYPPVGANLNDRARFQPPQGERAAEGNPAVGTVVYETVTRGSGQDFFLISQKAMTGATLRPTHYVVLYNNEPNVTIDNIAETTLQLCYLYGRATVPVGLATPVYYADRVCDRGRKYFSAHFAQGGAYSGQQYDAAQHQNMELSPQKQNMFNSMYYV